MTNRQMQAIATKQKILDVAEKLINEKGFEAVSVDDIVNECGVAKGTFYHYFKTKDDILVYVMRSPYERLRRDYEETYSKSQLDRLRLFLENWFSMVDRFNLHFSRQTFRLYVEPGLLGEYGGEVTHIDLGMELVNGCLRAAVDAGELSPETPVDVLTKEMMFSMQGSTLYQCKYAEEFDVMQWCNQFTKLVFDCLLKPYII